MNMNEIYRLPPFSVKTQKFRMRFGFEPRDLWVGLFWDKRETYEMNQLHFYVCLIPMIVFHVCVWSWKSEEGDRHE